jgi:hypothetical protein
MRSFRTDNNNQLKFKYSYTKLSALVYDDRIFFRERLNSVALCVRMISAKSSQET